MALEIMDLEITAVAVGVGLSVMSILFIVYKFCFAPYQVLKKCGIKGPMPVPIIGNYLIFKMHLREISQHLYDRYKEPIVGIYFGRTPTIYVRDPEMIKQITITEFDCFIDRPHKVPIIPDEYRVDGLAAAKGETWRNMRRILSPAFSASKMRMMVPLIKRSTDILIGRFAEVANSRQNINVLEFYSTFILETTMAAAFGLFVDVQRGKAEELINTALKSCNLKRNRTVMACIHLLMVMPCLEKLVHWFLCLKYALSWKMMKDIAFQVVESRKVEQTKFKDVLQLMIEASVSTGVDVEDRVGAECSGHRSSRTSSHKLSARDILDNIIMFLFDETSKNTLAHISYLLAINPDIQLKLQDEIETFYKENPEAKLYEAAEKISYLDYTVQESLRLYPPAVTISQLCVTPTVIGGVHIPRGTHVHIPIKQLHYDPKYWNNPTKFDPQRFSPQEKAKRSNSVHLPFGIGPRNCIGKRLALLEVKMTLIELLKQFSFVQGPETKVPLPIPDGFGSSPTEGIFVQVVHNNMNS